MPHEGTPQLLEKRAGDTLNSCADRVDPNRRDGNAVLTGGKRAAQDAQRSSMSNAATASVSYR